MDSQNLQSGAEIKNGFSLNSSDGRQKITVGIVSGENIDPQQTYIGIHVFTDYGDGKNFVEQIVTSTSGAMAIANMINETVQQHLVKCEHCGELGDNSNMVKVENKVQ